MQPNSRSSSGRLPILAEVWCLPHRTADATCFTGHMVGLSIGSYATRGGSQSTGGHGLLRLWVAGGLRRRSKFSITKQLVSTASGTPTSARWQRHRWQGLFQKIQPLRSIQQGVLYETVTGAEVFCLREWLGVAVEVQLPEWFLICFYYQNSRQRFISYKL